MLDQTGRLYSIPRLVALDSDVAEDAVQDALIRCWRDLPSLRDVTRFEAGHITRQYEQAILSALSHQLETSKQP